MLHLTGGHVCYLGFRAPRARRAGELWRSGATRGRQCGSAEDRGTGRQHPLFCQRYPTGRCVFGDEGVSSSRQNVASSLWRAAQARAVTATASSTAVGNQDWVGKVNPGKVS